MPPPPPVFVCAAELQEHTARIFSQLPARSTIPGAVHAGTHSAAPQLCETCDHAIPTVTVMPQHFSPLLPAPEAHMEPIWASTSVELPCVTGSTLSMEQGLRALFLSRAAHAAAHLMVHNPSLQLRLMTTPSAPPRLALYRWESCPSKQRRTGEGLAGPQPPHSADKAPPTKDHLLILACMALLASMQSSPIWRASRCVGARQLERIAR